MTAASLDALLTTLGVKISDLQSYLSADGEAELDLHSDHTYYGVVEAIADDIREANDLVTLSLNKVKTVVSPDEY